MLDLELDTSKNQYETGQSAAATAEKDQQKAIDDAFEKLQLLAQRQQELANSNPQQQAFEQRWQEEQLRREAEELRQQMQQLAQNSQNQQGSSASQKTSEQKGRQSSSSGSSSSSQGSSQSSGQSGRMTGSRGMQDGQNERQNQQMTEALRQSTNALQRAEEQMRKAVSDRDATAQQRAAAQLREAQDVLKNMLNQQSGSSVSDLAEQAQAIASAQKQAADQMKRMYGEQGSNGAERARRSGMSSESASGGEGGMSEMNDPNSVRFGYGFRRRNWQELAPRHLPTEQEKALANDKERLGQQLEQLERGMQAQAEALAGLQSKASSKLRKALSDAEQKELAVRMQKDAEWMREGYGDRNLQMQEGVTAGLEELSRQLQEVQKSVESGSPNNRTGGSDKASEGLSQVRAMREELERGGEETGQQGGQSDGPTGGEGAVMSRQGVQNAIEQLNTLRNGLNPHDRALEGYVNGAIGTMQHLTGAQDGLLDGRLSRAAAVSLERLEVELNKRVIQQRPEGARTGAPEASPEKYRDAVAEYFKKLSK